MSILIDETKRVIVQGITGREGRARAKLMKGYGTNIVGGVTPGRGGQEVEGLPVFDTVEEAWENLGPVDVSVLFIPAPLVRAADTHAQRGRLPSAEHHAGGGAEGALHRVPGL